MKDEQQHALLDYDRRDWHLGITAWFHIQMNIMNTLIRTHFSPSPGTVGSDHCIQHDMESWGRSHMTRDTPQYHIVEPVLAQSFAARVLALFYTALRDAGLSELSQVDETRVEAYSDVIQLRLRSFWRQWSQYERRHLQETHGMVRATPTQPLQRCVVSCSKSNSFQLYDAQSNTEISVFPDDA